MLDGKGYYRGSDILVSGGAGTGKSTLAAHFVNGACKRGERALYFAFEESPQQIIRNMRSVGIDLEPHIDRRRLVIHAERPTFWGLEMHLLQMTKLVNQFKPHVVVMDPITNLIAVGLQADVKSMLTRFTDFLKAEQITSLFTSLAAPDPGLEQSQVGISSLMDTWIIVRDIEAQGKRNRSLSIIKSRGMNHSNESREFRLTEKGFLLEEVPPCASGASSGTGQPPSRIRDRRQDGRVPRLRTTGKEKGR
jgi:circadian clock protein KaiC